MQVNLLGFSLEQLKDFFQTIGLSDLDAKRVFPWIHVKLARSFENMSDVPQKVREILTEKCTLNRDECIVLKKSVDGTQKALLKFADGHCVETVLIPDEGRNTICVSSQVGCAMGCKFCHTGTQKFTRNLSAHEIMSQIFFWKDMIPSTNTVTNIVFMGMGEPLLNFENLSTALHLLLSKKAHNFSRNKITVSSCGIVESSILELAKLGVKLAISLHAPNNDKRDLIMPINRKYNIEKVLVTAKKYLEQSNTDKITFEYLLLKDLNDSVEDALELAKLLRKISCKVNLIMYNDWPDSQFKRTSIQRANLFSQTLLKKGIRTIIRKSKGDDILAACGQLKGAISGANMKRESQKMMDSKLHF